MELQAVTGGLFERKGTAKCTVSTAVGSRKDNIRILSTETRECAPTDKPSIVMEYIRWKAATLTAAEAQYRNAPGQKLHAAFGTEFGPHFKSMAMSIMHSCRDVLRQNGYSADRTIKDILNESDEHVFSALGETIKLDIEQAREKAAPIQFQIRRFYSLAKKNQEPAEESAIPKYLQLAIDAAEKGSRPALKMLQNFAEEKGFLYAETYLTGFKNTRFLRLVPNGGPLISILKKFDLVQYFGKGIRDKMGWDYHMCIKLPGDPSMPAFTDVAATCIADQLDEIRGTSDPRIIHIKT